MKKNVILLVLALCLFPVAAETYRISEVTHTINGMTKAYVIDRTVTLDTDKIFVTEESLMAYITDYKQRLMNTRAFAEVAVDFTVDNPDDTGLCLVHLSSSIADSSHFIIVPTYPKYNSNDGLDIKLKVKDMNFFGTLSTLSSSLTFAMVYTENTSDIRYKLGADISYDYPFKAGIFDATWVNDDTISYTFGNTSPEWNAKMGMKFELPLDGYAVDLSLNQYSVRDFTYTKYGDDTYFKENANLSVPITIQEIQNWGKVTYAPYLDFTYNWDSDGINPVNSDLSSPTGTAGQTLSTTRINWKNNFRTGASATLTQSFSYNFQTQTFSPGISLDLKLYKGFTRIGFCTDIYSFAYLNNNIKIGSYLRGIRDDQYFSASSGYSSIYACSTPAALIVNLDMPIHLFTTDFGGLRSFVTEHWFHKSEEPSIISWTKILDIDFQLSPFIDIALIKNRATQTIFSYKDGFYSAGLELLMYPVYWSNVQFRVSGGLDVGRLLLSRFINTDWRDTASKYEISVGVGLMY